MNELRHRILEELRWGPAAGNGDVRISVADGGLVLLDGVVHTYADKCWIEESVVNVDGVCGVRNQLEVRLGWVTLEGSVPRAFQSQLAEAAVREVAGVRGITNRIAVT